MRKQTRLRYERGSTILELSVALIWVFMFIFGLTESARLVLAYTTLADAARAGARYAIVHGSYRTGTGLDGPSGPGNIDNVATKVRQITSGAGLSPDKVTVCDTGADSKLCGTDAVMYRDGTNNIGARVRVRVSYPFTSVLPLIVPFNVTIGSTSEGMICY